MFRTGPQVSAHDKEKQKQKKRLSFKDPEIEGPKKTGSSVAGAKQVAKSPTKEAPKRRSDTGGDTILEDQALKIARSVGKAFSHSEAEISIPRPSYIQSVTNSKSRIDSYKETESAKKDLTEFDNFSYLKKNAFKSCKTSENDRDYLNALSPALPDSTMRCPPVEIQNMKPKNGLSSIAGEEFQSFPTGAQHQIQILRYQLEQQGQQTQTAFHQVELLKGQLDAESSARYKAQTQNHQLMLQNKELLDHIERLFKQIEELEKHVETLEQEKKPTKIPYLQEQDQSRWSGTYGGRRLSSDQTMNERPSSTTRTPIATNRRGSLTLATKLNPPQAKATSTPTPNPTNRRGSLTSSLKPFATIQSKPTESANNLSNNTLRIGDAAPTTQKISNPFNSGWKSKLQSTNSSATADKTETKPRTNSLTTSSYSKLKSTDSKQSLFGSCTLAAPSSAASKKSSSSTSDLYKSESSAYPSTNKSLMIEETSLSNSNGAISSISAKETSKLPQYQKYSSWQRSKTMIANTNTDRVSGLDKETFKKAPETSLLFNK